VVEKKGDHLPAVSQKSVQRQIVKLEARMQVRARLPRSRPLVACPDTYSRSVSMPQLLVLGMCSLTTRRTCLGSCWMTCSSPTTS
jgi:hypothetical protein